MKCELCQTELEPGSGACPNCGTPVEEINGETPWQSPEWSKAGRGQGILYENLALSQESGETEPVKKETQTHWLPVAGASVLLLLFLGMIYLFSRGYDPNAAAITGRQGIRMDNRTFAIYYLDAENQVIATFRENQKGLPFDPERSLRKQYYDLEAGITWEDYFAAQAASQAASTLCLLEDAAQQGFTPDAETLEKLQNIPQMLSLSTAYSGFVDESGKGDIGAYVETRYGFPVDEATYCQYYYDTMYAQTYFAWLTEELGGQEQAAARLAELDAQYCCKLTRFASGPR